MTIAEGDPKAQSGLATTPGNPRGRRRIFELARTQTLGALYGEPFQV